MIRFARPSDAAAVAEIYAPFVTDTITSFELQPPSTEEMASRMARHQDTHPWIVLVDQSVQGYAYAGPHRSRQAYQWSTEVSVYLAASHRRRGLGQKLYQALFGILRDQGFANAFAGITLPNDASVALHRKMGFEEVGTYRKVGYKFDDWHDVGWYGLRLQDLPQPPVAPRAPQTSDRLGD